MMNRLLVCLQPASTCWQLDLHASADLEVLLVGWCTPGDRIESGVPNEVAGLLARSLTAISRVSFPSSDAKIVSETPRLHASVLARTMAKIDRAPGEVNLISTTDYSVAEKLFDDPMFPWHLQGQIALLFPVDAAPPRLKQRELLALMDRGWRDTLKALNLPGILGLVRPGVDGDVAGIWSFDKAFTQDLLGRLKSEAQEMHFEFRLVAEDTFAGMLAN